MHNRLRAFRARTRCDAPIVCAERMQLNHLALHDLLWTSAKLCHVNGGELEQIQFLLGHVSVLTTERYLGCKQNMEEPANDRFGVASSLGNLRVYGKPCSRQLNLNR
jgi:integrase